jgi:hypothetical protein
MGCRNRRLMPAGPAHLRAWRQRPRGRWDERARSRVNQRHGLAWLEPHRRQRRCGSAARPRLQQPPDASTLSPNRRRSATPFPSRFRPAANAQAGYALAMGT